MQTPRSEQSIGHSYGLLHSLPNHDGWQKHWPRSQTPWPEQLATNSTRGGSAVAKLMFCGFKRVSAFVTVIVIVVDVMVVAVLSAHAAAHCPFFFLLLQPLPVTLLREALDGVDDAVVVEFAAGKCLFLDLGAPMLRQVALADAVLD